MALFLGPPGELVPEENFWTLWWKGRLTEVATSTIRLGTTPSGLTSAHLHHPPIFFTGRMPFLPPNQQRQSTKATSTFGSGRRLEWVLLNSVTCTISVPSVTRIRLVFMARLRPQVWMPAERRAQFRVPNVPRSRISKRAPFRIFEHAQCGVFERTCLQRTYVVHCRSKWGRPLCYGHAAARWCLQWARGACGGRVALDGGVASILASWR